MPRETLTKEERLNITMAQAEKRLAIASAKNLKKLLIHRENMRGLPDFFTLKDMGAHLSYCAEKREMLMVALRSNYREELDRAGLSSSEIRFHMHLGYTRGECE